MEKNSFKTERKKMKNSVQKSMKIKGKKRPKKQSCTVLYQTIRVIKRQIFVLSNKFIN